MRRIVNALSTSLRGRRARFTVVAATIAASAIVIAIAVADNVGGFEIDADHATPSDALYSGNNAGNDWAQGTSAQGIFVPSASAPHTAATDLYGSNIDKNPAAAGQSALIGDGNSDSRFRTVETEQNMVSPAGKSPDDQWPVKPGNVHAKDDFSHAYTHASVADSPCDADSDADDVMLHLGGHVGDNEGSHFWGFEFMRNAPGGFANLKANDGSSFTLDFNRSVGDILVSFTVPGNSSEQVQLDLYRVNSFNGDGSANFTAATALAGCPASAPRGFSLLTSNSLNQVEAPPWNIPVCDPTTDNGANTCRLANGLTNAEDLLAERDFAEASIDLQAFGISPCFSNVVFSSRSSHPLEGADVKDVGGADFPLCGAKKGIKFHDRNADGDRDTGDETLANWQIKLYRDPDGDKVLEDTDDGVTGNGATSIATATTNASGEYTFPNLQNGDYIVCEVKQTGWSQSLPNAGSADKADCSIDTTLGALGRGFKMTGPDHLGNDFGNYQNGTKSGTKFEDTNGNGVRNTGEPGLAGVQIHLFGTDGLGRAVHEHATTDANGNYSISVPPGNYTACESVPAGYTQSFPTSGPSCAGHTGASGFGYTVVLTSGGTDAGNDFGNFRPGTKSGTKWEDLNANGVKDATEPGLAGVTIHLFGTDGRGNLVHEHAITGVNGAYSISVPPGNYTACESVPAGYTQSFPTSGPSCAGHTGASGFGYTVVLTSGGTDAGNDFGNFRPATISGMKFKDADAGGDKDAGETGLSGWEIHLIGTDGSGAAVHQHTTTNATGNYSFSVKPGTYKVCETISGKPGWVQSFPSGTDLYGSHAWRNAHAGSGRLRDGDGELRRNRGRQGLRQHAAVPRRGQFRVAGRPPRRRRRHAGDGDQLHRFLRGRASDRRPTRTR